MELPLQGGGKAVINQGCTIQAPVDSDAKWVNLGGSLGGAAINAGAQVVSAINNRKASETSSKENGLTMRKALEQAGHNIDGSGLVIIGGNDNNQGTAPPPETVVVPPAEPVIVPPAP